MFLTDVRKYIVWRHCFETYICRTKPFMIVYIGFSKEFSPTSRHWFHRLEMIFRNHGMCFSLTWSHHLWPIDSHAQSVQINQQYDKPTTFENRCSPLAQWNVQAMEIWKNLLPPPPPPIRCLYNRFTKSNRAGFVHGTCLCMSLTQ